MTFFSSLPVEIRRFGAGETKPLLAAIDAVCAEGRWMETLRYESTPAWEHALTEPDCPYRLLLVVAHRDQIVGWCRAFPDGSGNTAVIGIGLLPRYRNQGLGTHLLRNTFRWADQAGFCHLRLTVRSDNARAIHVFRKLGFVPNGRTERGQVEMVCRLDRASSDKEAVL